jgi:hypothetical protein
MGAQVFHSALAGSNPALITITKNTIKLCWVHQCNDNSRAGMEVHTGLEEVLCSVFQFLCTRSGKPSTLCEGIFECDISSEPVPVVVGLGALGLGISQLVGSVSPRRDFRHMNLDWLKMYSGSTV